MPNKIFYSGVTINGCSSAVERFDSRLEGLGFDPQYIPIDYRVLFWKFERRKDFSSRNVKQFYFCHAYTEFNYLSVENQDSAGGFYDC